MYSYKQKCHSMKSNLFTQFCISEEITLPCNMPDIEQVINCVIDPEILSIRAVNTMKGLSYEGQYLTGKKAVIELRLKQKLLYVAKFSSQSVHVIENEYYQSAYIVIPCQIEGTDPEYLIYHKYLKPEVIIEDINFNQVNKRNIFKNILVMIQLVMIPTYELCYTVHKNCKHSNLLMMYKDGKNPVELDTGLKYMSIKPKWSPRGDAVAFLSNSNGNWMLYIHRINTGTVTRITDPECFSSITGFCWSASGNAILFTASENNIKEIFITEINRFGYQQLTYGENVFSSFSPRCSPDGKQVGFLRTFFQMTDLWVMNCDGTDCRKVTNDGSVSYFDWSADSRSIFYISKSDCKNHMVYMLDITTENRYVIPICEGIPVKKKIMFSPDQHYISFIGSDHTCDNIYLYSLKHKDFQCITEYTNAKISDYSWNCDSSILYYSANDLFYYNIFSFELGTGKKSQLTFTTSTMIDLDYRPTIH